MSPKTNPKCPACGAGSWKVGFSQSKRRVYKCSSCGKKFNERAGTPFHGLHFPDGDALMGAILYAKYPLSSYDVAEIMGFNGVEVSHATICGWQPRFARYIRTIAKKYKIKFSRVWHVDEKFVPHKRVPSKRKRRGKRKWLYQISIVDSKGKVIASYLAPERSTKAIRKALKRAKVEAKFSPDIVVTDDYPAYKRGVKVLGRRTKHVTAHFEGKFIPYGKGVLLLSNNRIERYHSEIAPKIRSMRGVKNRRKGDSFFQFYRCVHNFLRRDTLPALLSKFKIKPTWNGLAKLFYP